MAQHLSADAKTVAEIETTATRDFETGPIRVLHHRETVAVVVGGVETQICVSNSGHVSVAVWSPVEPAPIVCAFKATTQDI